MNASSANDSAAADASFSDSVVEQLLAESEALLESIASGASSSSACYPSPPPLSPSASVTRASVRATDAQPALPASPASRPAPTPKRRRNSTRDRTQSELQFLRAHVTELEAEVMKMAMMMTKEKNKLSLQADSSASSASVLALPSQSISAWERLAQRQMRARTLCENENRSLQSKVAEHVKLIRGIRELLLAHQQHQSALSHWPQSYHNHLNNRMLHTCWEEATQLARLKRDAVSAYAESDRVLAENGAGSLLISTESNDSSHAFDDQTQRFVSRLATTRVFPFDVHATSNAAWCSVFSLFDWNKLLSEGSVDAAAAGKADIVAISDFRVVERSDDVYAVQYAVTLNVGGGGTYVTVRAQEFITRFASDVSNTQGKAVFIWQTMIDTSSYYDSGSLVTATDQAPSTQIRGTGWIVFHPQPGACSSSVMRSIFEFHTEKHAASHTINDDDNREVAVMKAWVMLGEACMNSVSLGVDKRLL